jgi:hypothetical protein
MGPAAAEAAAGVVSGGRVFSRNLGQLTGVSPALAAPRTFVLAGLTWTSPARPGIELRTRRAGEGWSGWVPASVTGHDADTGLRNRTMYGEPLWCGASSALQLRSHEPVRGLRVHLVAAGADEQAAAGTAQAAAFPLAQPILPAGPGQPQIIARSAWAGTAHPPSHTPEYGAVELAFVHHSENPNGYSAGEVPALILAIYDYHRFVRRWWDIGYNFVIDAFGRIWEARAGGIDQSVSGAQAGGYNRASTGVAMLGSFSSVLPSAAAINALEHLLAWKLSLHGVPALGRLEVRVDPAGAQFTRYRPNQLVSLPRVAGHRDGDSTACPGAALYSRLPQIRSRVAALAGTPAVLTLTGPATIPVGASAQLQGRLTVRGGGPIAGAPVVIQRVGGGAPLTQVTTQADGSWSTVVALPRSEILSAVHPVYPATISTAHAVGVAPQVALSYSQPPTLTGTVSPARPLVTVDVYQLVGPHRRLVSSQRVRTRSGGFSIRPNFHGRHGSFQIVATVPARGGLAAGSSAPLNLTR